MGSVRKLDSGDINLEVGNVDSLWIYPVKGMSGIQVKSTTFNNLGFLFDRRWMLVDPNGRFLSQREVPELALFKTSIKGGHLLISDSRGREVEIPISSGKPWDRRAVVWGSSCKADSYGAEVDEFFSDSLARRCHLVKMAEGFKRKLAPYYRVNSGDSVSFADGFPFLITTTASLEELGRRVGEHVPMDRFRPNIVIRNTTPFEEDRWRILTIGDHSFHLVKPCARCVVTTIDQATGGVTDGEPLRTLAKFRTSSRAGKSKILFGQNAVPADASGELSAGDSVALIKSRRPPSFRRPSSSAR